MKMLLSIVFVVLVGCSNPSAPQQTTTTPAPQSRTVMNSLWQPVTIPTSARAVGVVDLDSQVAAYNASHISDQWFIVDGEIPDLENAPPCDVFIVDKVTHIPITYPDGAGGTVTVSHTNWPRKSLVDNYSGFLTDAVAADGDLYIDVIPPAPTPLTAEQLYAKYSIYVIDKTGAILYEFHCDVVPDGFPGFTVTQYFSTMLTHANLIVQTDGNGLGWSVISGQVYTAP